MHECLDFETWQATAQHYGRYILSAERTVALCRDADLVVMVESKEIHTCDSCGMSDHIAMHAWASEHENSIQWSGTCQTCGNTWRL